MAETVVLKSKTTKAALLVFIAAFVPQVATAYVLRSSSIPEAYWGTWAPTDTTCKDADKSTTLVLSAQAYLRSATSCAVEYVSETPSPKGPIYSAHLQCSNPAGPAQKKTSADLIIRPGEANQIYVGPDFPSLKPYQRCSASPSANP
jgi:hypothetical protein